MYLCYIDESGTAQIPGNTSHFILAGLSIPISDWKKFDANISDIKKKYQLEQGELHTAWILRKYPEQRRIENFENLNYSQRRAEVDSYRKSVLLKLQKERNTKTYRQTKKNYKHTNDYIHLSYTERVNLIKDIATAISKWKSARLFAECIDKVYFDPQRSMQSVDEQSFEQVISRFEHFLQIKNPQSYGIIIHDNNQTIAKKHTELMKKFHNKGTFWTKIEKIIETPLFVDSQLTSMIQIADLCSYAIRRYLENEEEELFKLVFKRADTRKSATVGVRHFSKNDCSCIICKNHASE